MKESGWFNVFKCLKAVNKLFGLKQSGMGAVATHGGGQLSAILYLCLTIFILCSCKPRALQLRDGPQLCIFSLTWITSFEGQHDRLQNDK